MKKILLTLVAILSLTGCSFEFPEFSGNLNNSSENSSENISSEEKTSSENSQEESSEQSSEESSSEEIFTGPQVIDFYAINDFHGRISEDKSDNVPGISKLATYLKEQKSKNEKGYVFLNSGDYWQDTYESGMNKGELLTKCLDVMECETISLGNHEFDWGVDVIEKNMKLTNYTTFLGANIYNYPDTSTYAGLGEPYKIITRKGVKIGIIGGVGEDQITSITSSNWENLTFKNPSTIIKQLSDKLRIDEKCDLIILSLHADQDDTNPSSITSVSMKSGKRYVDAVFCAHSHQKEISTYNGVPFIQGGAHGKQVSHIQITFDEGNVSYTYTDNDGYGKINSYAEDSEINAIINSYLTPEFNNNKNEVVGTIQASGGFISKNMVGRIQAKATYDRLKELGYSDIDVVINNGGRSSSPSGEMTRESIFNMTPFTNYTYVVKNIKGSDIIGECVDYDNPYYCPDTSINLNANEYYTVACIDYVMLHKNTNRSYNYFPSYNENNVTYILQEYPYEIIEDYLETNKTVNISQFNTSNYTVL